MRRWIPRILAGCLLGGVGLVVAFCAGIIRPPRPMFCNSYGAGGFGVVPMWQPGEVLADDHGHWLWVDDGDNVLALQATGAAERGRSHALRRGLSAARFRLGGAESEDDERDRRYATVPRTRNALIVILPDGRWQAFPLPAGQAQAFFRARLEGDRVANLLPEAAALLDQEAKVQFDEFLLGYVPP